MIEEFEEAMGKLKAEMDLANERPSEALRILIENERNKNTLLQKQLVDQAEVRALLNQEISSLQKQLDREKGELNQVIHNLEGELKREKRSEANSGKLSQELAKWRERQRKWEDEQSGYMKDLNELHRLNSDLHNQICDMEVKLDEATRQTANTKQVNQELNDRLALR